MKFLATYNTQTKDYTYYITLNEHTSFKIIFIYSPGHTTCEGGTYGSAEIVIDICGLRGVLRQIPDFIWEFSWYQIEKSLVKFGFTKTTEPTKLQEALYINEHTKII